MNWLKNACRRFLWRLIGAPPPGNRWRKGMDIGSNSYVIRGNLDGIAPRLITIGHDCVLAPTAMILTHDASCFIHTGKYRFAPVIIGDRCFLGYNSVIMPGVTIGDNVIVGAGAVVTRDVPAGQVVGGVPARVIGNTRDVLKKWENELIEPPYCFGVSPSPDQLAELQKRAVASCPSRKKT